MPSGGSAFRLYERGRVVNGGWWCGWAPCRWWVERALMSLSPPLREDQARWEARPRGRNSKRAVRRPDEKRRLPQQELG
jgi:hypothetical protein